MTRSSDRSPVLKIVIPHPRTQGWYVEAIDLASIQLSKFEDLSPPDLMAQGVAFRYYPDAGRHALVPLGERWFISPSGLLGRGEPVPLDPDGPPVRLALLGASPPWEVEVEHTLDATELRFYHPPASPARPLPPLPQEVVLPEPIAAAADRAVAAGGPGGLVAAGLVLRFGTPRIEDLLEGRDPLAEWAERALQAAATEEAIQHAATMAVQWDQAWRRLDESLDPDSPAWTAELGEALRLRDDLASCARALRRLDRADELDAILRQADAGAAPWLTSLPFRLELEDPHLQEVARLEDPFWARRAWLTAP